MPDSTSPLGDPRFPYSGPHRPVPPAPTAPASAAPPQPVPFPPAPEGFAGARPSLPPAAPAVNTAPRPTRQWFFAVSVVLFIVGLFLTAYGVIALNRARSIASSLPVDPIVASPYAPSAAPGSLIETDLEFGQTAHWSDGFQVTVSEPTEFGWADEYDREYFSLPGHTPIEFDIHVVNGSAETVKSISFRATVVSASEQGEELLRCSDDKFSLPSAPIRPDTDLNYKACFQVKNPSDVELTWSGDYDRGSASFSSR